MIESLRRYYSGADLSAPAVSLDGNLSEAIQQYLELRSQKDVIDDEMKRLSAAVIDYMGASSKAVCKSGANEYHISYKSSYREGIKKDGLEALKAFHPDIYSAFVSTTESRRFTVTIKECGA